MKGLVGRGADFFFGPLVFGKGSCIFNYCCYSILSLIFLCQRYFLDMVTLGIVFPYAHTSSKYLLSEGTVLSIIFFHTIFNLSAALRLQRCDTGFTNGV